MDWIERFNQYLPAHFYAPAVSILTVLGLWLMKRLIVYRLHKWASGTRQQWDDILVRAVSFPADFLILASGIVVLTNLLSLPKEIDRLMTVALQACVIISVVVFLDGFTRGILDAYSSRRVFSSVSHGLTKGILRGFIIGLGVLIFMDLLGISITPILASLGIGSLAVALALQDTLSNFFAGIYVSVDKPIAVGHFVKLESSEEGYVVDIGWRNTRIRTLPNNEVVVPNSKLVGSVITNYHRPDKEIAVLVDLSVHYRSDLKRVEEVTAAVGAEVMKKVPGGVPEFAPFIRYHTFGGSGIGFTVILRAKEFVDQYLLKHEFIKMLHERYRKEGIVIPFPIQTLEVSPETLSALKGGKSPG